VLRGAPTVRLHISSSEREFIIDIGSSVSLIRPGVSSSEIKTTSVLPIGLTGDALQMQGGQEIKFA
jgi:hypothetical protein